MMLAMAEASPVVALQKKMLSSANNKWVISGASGGILTPWMRRLL
jgi:hypothetical protein